MDNGSNSVLNIKFKDFSNIFPELILS